MEEAKGDTGTARQPRQNDGTQLSQAARQAADASAEQRRERIEESDAPVDEKGNLIPPQREESGMAGSADENWRAGQIAEQPGPFPPEE